MVIVDWVDPTKPPVYLRTYGLVGSQPGATGPVPPSLHGAISAHEHPNAANKLARAATADDIIGNRVYGAWGVGDDGVLTILDRKKLLPPLSNGRGGTYTGDPDQPTEADYRRLSGGDKILKHRWYIAFTPELLHQRCKARFQPIVTDQI